MMVRAAAGPFDKAQRLREFVADNEGTLVNAYRVAGVARSEAVFAHRRGQFQEVVDKLSPDRHDLTLAGARHAQCDLFLQVLSDAA